ncbi:hypothetical protein LNP74_05135 [Klebsiella pneumoniae subsp. pneumoniae]|nr:hypothetical protein [Klebsiella pneumoniae subsp. pneumoniae]
MRHYRLSHPGLRSTVPIRRSPCPTTAAGQIGKSRQPPLRWPRLTSSDGATPRSWRFPRTAPANRKVLDLLLECGAFSKRLKPPSLPGLTNRFPNSVPPADSTNSASPGGCQPIQVAESPARETCWIPAHL